jgi:hypothetical protein
VNAEATHQFADDRIRHAAGADADERNGDVRREVARIERTTGLEIDGNVS